MEELLKNALLQSFTVSTSAMRTSSYAEDYRIRGYQRVHLYRDVFANGLNQYVLDPSVHFTWFEVPASEL